MLKQIRPLLLSAALFAGLSSIGHAQLLTADTIGGSYASGPAYASSLLPLDGMSVTQTFTNITSIDTLTLRFGSNSNVLAGTVALDVYFSEWNVDLASNVLDTGTIYLAPPTTWTLDSGVYYYDATIDLSPVAGSLNALSTYGFTVGGTALSAVNDIRIFPGQAAYGDGAVHVHNAGNPITSSGDVFHAGVDFAFIGSSVMADHTPFAPVPEASTIAVLFAGLFVGGVVFKRLRERRREAAALVS
ncbi:MAG: hypothetical protein R3F03_13530 [Opitutaceae bacterium]